MRRNPAGRCRVRPPAGLPDRLLRLFEPRDAPPHQQAVAKKAAKLPYTGISAYLAEFAVPGDAEYEPQVERPPSPRKVRNREFQLQARLDKETQQEK